MAMLTLVPDEAALSVKRRVETIAQAKAYIREVVARYDGLNSFENLLADHGVAAEVAAIVNEAE
jgi:hypothetical protein